jgi:hypothetical protein
MAKPIPEGYDTLTTYLWSAATHIEDVPPEEMAERARAAMGSN